jgi:hypothetical protein
LRSSRRVACGAILFARTSGFSATHCSDVRGEVRQYKLPRLYFRPPAPCARVFAQAPCSLDGIGGIARQFVGEYYAHASVSNETASRFVLAAHELVENAVRCASDGVCTLHIRVDRDQAVLESENRAAPRNVEALIRLIDEMSDHRAERIWFFVDILRESTRLPDARGLGLSRIYAEAEMDLSYGVSGDVVTVRAAARLSRGVSEVRSRGKQKLGNK